MKSARHILITILFTAGIFSSVLYVSCNKDKCGTTTCQNGGTCADNVCVCPSGYSGNDCGTGWSDASIGTYRCTRSNCAPSQPTGDTWLTAVTKDAANGGYTIDLSNFDNSNHAVQAIIDSAGKISVSPAVGTYGISASGTYKSGVINLHFTTSSTTGVAGYTCNMTMIKE